jgi:spermidine synthase
LIGQFGVWGNNKLQFFWSRKKSIAEAEDAHGRILVEQKGSMRYLVFGEDSEQSAVCMRFPLRLQYEYSRAMLLGALCHDAPETALFMGLGAGALVRSCLDALPGLFDAEVIELRPEVVRLAQQYMGFKDDERLTLRVGDALELLESAEQADLVFLDLYNEQGPSRAHMAWDFLAGCQARLSPGGWLVINQWALLDSKPLATPLLQGLFAGHYWEVPVTEGNVILLIPASTEQNLPVEQLRTRAAAVGKRQGHDLLSLVNNIRLASR